MDPKENAEFFQTYTGDVEKSTQKKISSPKWLTLPISPMWQRDTGKLGIVLDSVFDLCKLFFDFLLRFISTLLQGCKYICWWFFGISISLSILLIVCVGSIYALGVHETENFSQFQEKLIGSISTLIKIDTSSDSQVVLKTKDDCSEKEKFHRGDCVSLGN